MATSRNLSHPEVAPSESKALQLWTAPEPGDQPVFSSTVLVSGSATPEEKEQKVREMAERGLVVEHCRKCGSALDVSASFPLSLISCPECGERFKVLERFGHFLLLSVLGQGGMGCVCRAFDQTLERDVALKLVRNIHMDSEEYINQLKEEAKSMGLVVHPNVVRVYSSGLENGIYYIAMEIVAGGTLSRAIEHQRLPEASVVNIAIQVAEGLQAAYHVGLLHRDVKPGNILFADTTTVKVADFGLALTVQQAAQVGGDVWGTPEYVAPEKILKQGEDVRSDIYSLGATLYHALTGRRVFEGTTACEVALKQVENRPVALQTYAPTVSNELSAIVAQSLEKDPENRQSSYEELISQLRYVETKLEEGSIGPQRLRENLQTDSQAEQRNSALLVIIALIVVVVLGAGFLIFRNKEGASTARVPGSQTAMAGRSEKLHVPIIALAKNDINAPVLFLAATKDPALTPCEHAWAQMLNGCAWLGLGETAKAREAFAAVPLLAAPLQDRSAASFLARLSSKLEAGISIRPEDGASLNLSTVEAVGLLFYGLQAWQQGQPEVAVPLLRDFRKTSSKGDAEWIEDLKPLASVFVERWSRFEILAAQLSRTSAASERLAVAKQLRFIDPILAPRVDKLLATSPVMLSPTPPPQNASLQAKPKPGTQVITTPLALKNNHSIFVPYETTIDFVGEISGEFEVRKTGLGILVLSGANTYSGPTSITQGTVVAGRDDVIPAILVLSNNNGAGSTLDLNGKRVKIPTLVLSSKNAVVPGSKNLITDSLGSGILQVQEAMFYNSGPESAQNGQSIISAHLDLNGTLLKVMVANSSLTETEVLISGDILDSVGSGRVVKEGRGTVQLSGKTDFGAATISGGIMSILQPQFPKRFSLKIGQDPSAGAILHLPNPGIATVRELILDGNVQPSGTYDASNAKGRITGAGEIRVP